MPPPAVFSSALKPYRARIRPSKVRGLKIDALKARSDKMAILQIGGFNGPSIGFQLGGKGNITEKQRLWRNAKNPQSIGSGVYVNGHVFIPDADRGTIRCIDPKTGKNTWSARTAGKELRRRAGNRPAISGRVTSVPSRVRRVARRCAKFGRARLPPSR